MEHYLTAADFRTLPVGESSDWRRLQLCADLGNCFTDYLSFNDGLSLAYSHYLPQHDLREEGIIERDNLSLTIAVALEGRSSTQSADGDRFDFVAGHSSVAAFRNTRADRCFSANVLTRQLRLIIEEPLLHRYGLGGLLDGVKSDKSVCRLRFGRHSGVVRKLSDTLVHLHDRAASLLEVQIAALSLLSEQTKPLVATTIGKGKIRPEDRNKLLQARDLLIQNFDLPITISYLCATVGTNEFKLKQGFREEFGTSPHRMLTDIRMRNAWQLLELGNNAASVGYMVGFQHPSSFSTAFERYYGRSPKSIFGRRARG